jgi:hypothetical protein
MRCCAYCGEPARVTREEIFPKFLARADPTYGTFVDATRGGLVSRSAPTKKDVCAACNNGPLSDLDGYGAKLYKTCFAAPVIPPVDIVLRYDYHKLLRWLLKLSYNDARSIGPQARTKNHAEILRQFAPYILGRESYPPFATNLFAGVVVAVRTTPAEQRLGPWLSPQVNRLGVPHLWHAVREQVVLFRLVSFNSYVFLILSWSADTSPLKRQQAAQGIVRDNGVAELKPLQTKVRIRAACADARRYLLDGGLGRPIRFRRASTTASPS